MMNPFHINIKTYFLWNTSIFFLITEMNSSIFCFLQKSVILDTVKTADFSHLLLHSGISTLLRKGGWKDKERLVLSQTWFWPQGLPARISDIPGGPQSMLWERQLLTKESQTPWGVGWAGGGGWHAGRASACSGSVQFTPHLSTGPPPTDREGGSGKESCGYFRSHPFCIAQAFLIGDFFSNGNTL